MTAIGFDSHNHHACINGSVAAAEAHCAEHGLNLTPIRRRVLEILLEDHRALGAYDILDKLREEGQGAQPPVAYRALDFLVGIGFAHKIEHRNAFIACAHPSEDHAPVVLTCRECDMVAETQALSSDILNKAASATGFTVERTVIEAIGICPNCQGEGQSSC